MCGLSLAEIDTITYFVAASARRTESGRKFSGLFVVHRFRMNESIEFVRDCSRSTVKTCRATITPNCLDFVMANYLFSSRNATINSSVPNELKLSHEGAVRIGQHVLISFNLFYRKLVMPINADALMAAMSLRDGHVRLHSKYQNNGITIRVTIKINCGHTL